MRKLKSWSDAAHACPFCKETTRKLLSKERINTRTGETIRREYVLTCPNRCFSFTGALDDVLDRLSKHQG